MSAQSSDGHHGHHHSLVDGLKHVEHKLQEIDIAEIPTPHTYDPALNPENQHQHQDRIHDGAAHGDRHIRYASADVPGRVDLNPVAGHHHHDPVNLSPYKHNQKSIPASEEEKKNIQESSERSIELQDADNSSLGDNEKSKSGEAPLPINNFKRILRKYRWVIVLFLGLFFTSWWISILAQPKVRHRWLIPTFLWLFLMIRFITFYVPTRPLLMGANWIWERSFIPVRNRIPRKLWVPIEALCLAVIVLVATFATPETADSKRKDRAVSFFGYVVMYFLFFVISRHKKKIRWHTVIWGMFLQFVIALFVLRTKAGYDFFNWISFLARELLSFSGNGAAFLTSASFVKESWFIISTLCSIIFFIAFVHIWYYFGVIQWLIGKFSQGVFWLMQISGAEAVVAAASPFVGQGESAILIKPFLPHCTDGEIFQVLTSGFSTVSGSVLASYIHMGVNAAALVTSCVMSIPASIAAAKLVLPETEESLTSERSIIPEDATEEAHNVIHAFSNGAMFGLNVALSMGANILCIIALVALIDALLGWFGKFWGIPNLTLEQIMGYIFYPASFLLGTSRDGDLYKVAKLLGIKIIQNEFVAYNKLNTDPEYTSMSTRSKVLATYSLCGFSNLGSCGIQLGVLTSMAPNRKGTIASLMLHSLIVGCMCTMTSACVAGMLMVNMADF
nr:ST.8 [Starmerella bombicola]